MLHQHTGGHHHHHQNVTSHGAMAAASTFSLFFPLPKGQQWPPQVEEAAAYSYDDHSTVTTSPSSPASSSSAGSVDCTLSLGTPSSRRRAEPEAKHSGPPQPCPSVSAAAALSWDAAAECYYYQQGKLCAGAAARGAVGHDQLLDRRCANCGTSSTPLWRNGPRGPKSLCNACGIRFKKEERRAAESGGGACGYTAQRAHGSAAPVPPRAVPTYGEEQVDADAPLLAWRLNVVPPAPAFSVWPERASLYQYN